MSSFIFRDTTVTPNKFWLCSPLDVTEISEQETIAFNKGFGSSSVPLDSSNIVRLQQVRDATARVRSKLVQDIATQVPVTVQGASEDYILSTMQQVQVNTAQLVNTVNGNVVIMRDQVKTHVTSEADRVIAAV